jgi:hypothetical protein
LIKFVHAVQGSSERMKGPRELLSPFTKLKEHTKDHKKSLNHACDDSPPCATVSVIFNAKLRPQKPLTDLLLLLRLDQYSLNKPDRIPARLSLRFRQLKRLPLPSVSQHLIRFAVDIAALQHMWPHALQHAWSKHRQHPTLQALKSYLLCQPPTVPLATCS